MMGVGSRSPGGGGTSIGIGGVSIPVGGVPMGGGSGASTPTPPLPPLPGGGGRLGVQGGTYVQAANPYDRGKRPQTKAQAKKWREQGYYGASKTRSTGSGGGGGGGASYSGGGGGGGGASSVDLSNITGRDSDVDAWLESYRRKLSELENSDLGAPDEARIMGSTMGAISDQEAGAQEALAENLAARGLSADNVEGVGGQVSRQVSEAAQRNKALAAAQVAQQVEQEKYNREMAKQGLINNYMGMGLSGSQVPAQLALARQGLGLQQWQAQQNAALGWGGLGLQRDRLAADIDMANRSYEDSAADRALAQYQAMMNMGGYYG